MTHRPFATVLAVALGTVFPTGAAAQSVAEQQLSPIETPDDDQASIGFGEGSFIVAPIPFSSPMIGSGLALGGGYLFQMDEGSDSSLLGVGAMKSDNGSQAYGLNASIAFGDNRWQAAILAARADLNYDLITALGTVPLEQSGEISRLNLAYGFTPDLSIGFQGRYLRTDIRPSTSLGLPPSAQRSSDLTVITYGLTAEYDRRDDDLYPTTGSRVFLAAAQNDIVDGILAGTEYAKGYLTWDMYRALGDRLVLAVRVTACAAEPQTPFYDLCSLGGTDAMRGFNVTRFLDERLVSAQVELRGRLTKRIGAVAFAGTGAVGTDFDTLGSPGYAGGIGVRYRVSKKFPVEFAVDVTHNNFDEQLLYIYVGQRF